MSLPKKKIEEYRILAHKMRTGDGLLDEPVSWPEVSDALHAASDAITELLQAAAPAQPKCKYGDPMCPCQDGDACHYEGANPMKPPAQPVAQMPPMSDEEIIAKAHAVPIKTQRYPRREELIAFARAVRGER